jgi:hypothetical protein
VWSIFKTVILAPYSPIRGSEPTLNPVPVTAAYLGFVYWPEYLKGKIYPGMITSIEVRFNKLLAGIEAKFKTMNPHSYRMAIKHCRNRS